jgi:hypothetical protein
VTRASVTMADVMNDNYFFRSATITFAGLPLRSRV